MTRLAAIVLYEDEAGQEKNPGLHALLVACAADSLNVPVWSLTPHVKSVMRGGNARLLKACRQDGDLLRRGAEHVLAIFDRDRIKDLVQVLPGMSDQEIVAAILSATPRDVAPTVFLLDRNTESVVFAAIECIQGTGKPRPKKHPDVRDQHLHSAAFHPSPLVRDCVLEKVQSLRPIVATLIEALRPRCAPSSA